MEDKPFDRDAASTEALVVSPLVLLTESLDVVDVVFQDDDVPNGQVNCSAQ
jgi:hypothetical protein